MNVQIQRMCHSNRRIYTESYYLPEAVTYLTDRAAYYNEEEVYFIEVMAAYRA